MSVVVDASAILAILFEERGEDVATEAARGSMLSAVNLIEVREKFARRTGSAEAVAELLEALQVTIVSFDEDQARIAAELKGMVGKKDSLADRACLALALLPDRHASRAITNGPDSIWASIFASSGKSANQAA